MQRTRGRFSKAQQNEIMKYEHHQHMLLLFYDAMTKELGMVNGPPWLCLNDRREARLARSMRVSSVRIEHSLHDVFYFHATKLHSTVHRITRVFDYLSAIWHSRHDCRHQAERAPTSPERRPSSMPLYCLASRSNRGSSFGT